VGKTNGNMDNLLLPNEEDRESGKSNPEYKGHPNPPTIPQELNTIYFFHADKELLF
jgi:hypothetical protein